MQNRTFVSISDAAVILGIKSQTARDWLWKNKFPVPTVKINGKRLVPAHLLNEYIDRLIILNSSAKAFPSSSSNPNLIQEVPEATT